MKGDLVTRLLLETQQFDDNLAKATKSVRGFSQEGQGLGSVLGGLGKSIGKLAAGIGVATTATEAFNQTIAASQTLTDFFAKTSMQASAAVDTFFASLANGDITNFISNLNTAISAASNLADILDDLATFSIFKDPQLARIERDRAKYEEILKNPKSTEQEKQMARAGIDKVNQQQLRLTNQSAQKYANAYVSSLQAELAKLGVDSRVSQMLIKGIQNYGYDYLVESNKRLEYLEKERQKVVARATRNGYTGGTLSWWGEKEWKGRRYLSQINDKYLQKSTQYLTQAYTEETKMIKDRTRSNRAYYKGTTGGRHSGGHRGTPSPSDIQQEQKTILDQTIQEINDIIKQRDYLIQVGIDDEAAEKSLQEIETKLQEKYGIILGLKSNILANGSVNSLNEFKRAIDLLRDNTTDEKEYRYLNSMSNDITKAIERLTDSVKEISLELPNITGFNGTTYDTSLFQQRLKDLHSNWDKIQEKILNIERNYFPKPVEDTSNEFGFMNDPTLSELEKQTRYQEALNKVTEEESSNIDKTAKYIQDQKDKYEEAIAPLKQQQDLVGQGINAVEKVILQILRLGMNPNTDWWQRYKKSPQELEMEANRRVQAEIQNFLAGINESLANVNPETGKGTPFSVQLDVSARDKAVLKERLENDKDYLNTILNNWQVDKLIGQLNESLKNPYSDATFTINFEGLSKEQLDMLQKYLLQQDSFQRLSIADLEVKQDIEKYQEQLNKLNHNAVFDGIGAVTSLANSWEGLANTLEGNSSVFNKVMATIEAIVNTIGTVERFTEVFKEISSLSETLNAATETQSAISEGLGLLDTATTQTAITLSQTLSGAKEAETVAHSANAGAIATEATAYSTLVASQAAAIASALTLYKANKMAAAAGIFNAHSYIPFAGVNVAAGMVAEMEGILAGVAAFAQGGIVGGTSYSGDKILTRLNSGEMVLNRKQQGNLFSLLEGGIGNNSVHFVIKGQELVGVLDNYNNKMSRVK